MFLDERCEFGEWGGIAGAFGPAIPWARHPQYPTFEGILGLHCASL